MISTKTILSFSALVAVAFAKGNTGGNTGGNTAAADSTTLSDNAIQSGSFLDGSQGLGAETGQASSTTSQNNFINFCSGKTLTNGLQITDGSCNGIVMGDIPAKATMISSIITFPQEGQTIQENQDFNISVQTQNLQAGSFTNADATYYAAPQQLNGQGQVIGHTHITVQDLGNSLNPTTPPDPTQFAFFKGINDAGNGDGLLSAAVAGGLPAGNFRVCTMTSASNHQPVVMPVAQRGSQDDCTKFTVQAAGGNANNAGGNNGKNNNKARFRSATNTKRDRLANIKAREFIA
ncbi:hypothetical protein M406DRAFT_51317 [Cryphonectria parasitica EP155]|uniref:Ribosomal protein s17 n=1 Tax=Cryphonectria parasitica (strain ATCC 38755 / EP155) TaxID=660469 RepID=A0A9P4XYN3_CRYP1|nr:uncharacterized protein M406DRAFT_51317 [Cryphonectria parasitica EP155]KAF3763734.1 hypothetical protein M406DRAFT_51317 [Cryphonectria parasitica EP155]